MHLIKNESGATDKIFLTPEEWELMKTINGEFQRAKMAIADLEIQKQGMLDKVREIHAEFDKHDKGIVSKYGPNSIINLATGEVTQRAPKIIN